MKGVHRTFLPSFLDKFMQKERLGSEGAFNNILADIGTQYPLP